MQIINMSVPKQGVPCCLLEQVWCNQENISLSPYNHIILK